jgi:hypothetical protein
MPLTFQETEVLVEPVTVALRVCDAPKSTDAEAGDTVTLRKEGVGGGGVGVTEPVSPPAQPATLAAKARRAKTKGAGECGCAAAQDWVTLIGERGRMHWRNAGEGPARRNAACACDAFFGWIREVGKLLELRVLAQLITRTNRVAQHMGRQRGSHFGTHASRRCFIRELRGVGPCYWGWAKFVLGIFEK